MTVIEALALAKAVKDGKAVLHGKVVFHRQDLTVDAEWSPTDEKFHLSDYTQRITHAMQRAVQQMERVPLDTMTAAEVEAMAEKYERYKNILSTNGG